MTTVHDEEEGISLRLALLLEQPQNRGKLAVATAKFRAAEQKTTNLVGKLNPAQTAFRGFCKVQAWYCDDKRGNSQDYLAGISRQFFAWTKFAYAFDHCPWIALGKPAALPALIASRHRAEPNINTIACFKKFCQRVMHARTAKSSKVFLLSE